MPVSAWHQGANFDTMVRENLKTEYQNHHSEYNTIWNWEIWKNQKMYANSEFILLKIILNNRPNNNQNFEFM
jgi:hypothetical protein